MKYQLVLIAFDQIICFQILCGLRIDGLFYSSFSTRADRRNHTNLYIFLPKRIMPKPTALPL
jgi:hypothetical protein